MAPIRKLLTFVPAVVALAALLAGCAPTTRGPLVSDPASIEVANRSHVDYSVFVDGQHVADVRSGHHALIDGLRSGTHRVSAVSSQADAPERESTVQLAVGTSAVWDILPEPPAAPVDVPRGFGSLRLVNQIDDDLVVSIDGEVVARLLEGDTRLLTAVSAGERTVVARRGLGQVPLSVPVHVTAGQLTEVPIDGPRGSVEVRNATGEPIEVAVDGRTVGTVETGAVRTFGGILAGARTLTARGETTQRLHTRDKRIVYGEVALWPVEAAAGGVQVINDTAEAVRVWIDDMEIGRVPPGEERLFAQVSLGRHTLRAVTLSTGFDLRMPVEIRTDQTFVWPLTLDEGVLIIENRTQEPVQTYMDGEPYERIAPGETRTFSQVPAGRHDLSAFGEVSHRIVPTTVDVTAARAARWAVEPSGVSAVVRNDRPERVRLYLDAVFITRLEPGETRVLDGLVAGERLLEAMGERTGRVWRERATLTADERAVLDVREPAAVLIVTNRSNEELILDAALAPDGEPVPRGSTRTYHVPVSRRKVLATGKESRHVHERSLALEEGEEETWVVEKAVGTIEVFNRRDEDVDLWLDGAPAGRIEADGSLLLEGLDLGRHELLATGRQTGHGTRGVRRVEAGETNHWQIGHDLAVLVVVNETAEEQDVLLDGRPYGRAAAGEVRAFGGIPAGQRMLMLKGKRSLEVQEATLQFEEGRTERFRVEPLRAGLVVRNERKVPIMVYVDGERVGEAPARGVYEGPVAQGSHTVETRTTDALESTVQSLRVSPYQTYEIRVPRPTGTVRATNMTGLDLEVSVGDHVLGTVAPGSTRLFHGIDAGQQRIRASHGDESWSLDTWVDGTREREWVIRPGLPD